MTDELFLDICRRQYGAMFAMLRHAMDACPEALWDKRAHEPPFWQQAYHTLWAVDFYLSPAPGQFQKPSLENQQANRLDKQPDFALAKEALTGYLESVEARFHRFLSDAGPGRLEGSNPFQWTGPTLAHRLLYSLRHAQHHLGWMASILRRAGIEPPKWIAEPK
ncbi:MAG: DinB family protein [Candidatus Sumerlaeota bacterium]|nr:DinB family protein [Candidatus Sumerlaeota bacterium]